MKRRLTWAVVVALVVLPLLVLWARRWAAGEQLVAEANALAMEPFVRPSHRPGSIDGGVAECLDRVSAADAGEWPPLELNAALTKRLALSIEQRAWLDAQQVLATDVRECVAADFVGQTPRVGPFAGVDDVSGAKALSVGLRWLHAEAAGAIDGGSPEAACLDVSAVERDAPRLEGLIGAMLASTSAVVTMDPCMTALVHASADDRRRARDTLVAIQAGLLPFSDVLRIERVVLSMMHFREVLTAAQRSRLPPAGLPHRSRLGSG